MREGGPPPPPRPVPAGAGGFGAGIFAAIGMGTLVLSTLAVIAMAVFQPPWSQWALDAKAQQTSAVVTGIESLGGGVQRAGEICFEFLDGDGRHWTGCKNTDRTSTVTAARAGHVPIEYDPKDPSTHRLLGEDRSTWGFWVLVGGFFLGLLIGPPATPVVMRNRRLYRFGTAIPARVVAVEETHGERAGRTVMRFHYEYATPSGVAASGSWDTESPPAVGANVWVLFDPGRPTRSVLADPAM